MKTLVIAALVAVSTTFAAPTFAEDHDAEFEAELDYLEELMSYFDLSEQFVELASKPEAAVFFAVEGIVEIHEENETLPEAIAILEGALTELPGDRAARNIIRFQLRDLYAETGNTQAAIEQLQAVLTENGSQ